MKATLPPGVRIVVAASCVLCALLVSCVRPGAALALPTRPPSRPLRVVLADPDNRQFLVFWVAVGIGAFERRGLDLDLTSVAPPSPRLALLPLREGEASVALLPPPLYLEAFAEDLPLVLVANLLTNDPIALVARRREVIARKVPLGGPLSDRLRALGDIPIGIAPNPPPRLRALFREAEVPLDEARLVVLGGRQQNAAFRAGEVDALYAHTPFLENAIVDDDAVVVVDQPAGEGAAMRGRTIHGLLVTRELLAAEPQTARALVEGLDEAAALLRENEALAAAALSRALPEGRDEKDKVLVHLYRAAVPETLTPTIAGVRASLSLFPATRAVPAIDDGRIAAHLDGRLADAAAQARVALRAARRASLPGDATAERHERREALVARLSPLVSALVAVLFTAWINRRGARTSPR